MCLLSVSAVQYTRFYPFGHCGPLLDCVHFHFTKNKAGSFSFVYMEPPMCKFDVPVIKINLLDVQVLVSVLEEFTIIIIRLFINM